MRKYIYIIGIMFAVCSCSTTKKSQQGSQQPVAIEFNQDSAYAFCAAQCSFGPRTMNSPAHEQCLQWIQQRFQQYGCQVTLQNADLKGYDGTVLHSTNIIAASPKSQLPRVLLCAHWDSRPWADNDPDSANWHKPVMAANDGASGVAVMLELARLLQQHDSASVAVDFICFDAEDWGVPQWSDEVDADSWALGAQHWASDYASRNTNPASSSPSYDYAILLDMVGGQGAKFYQEQSRKSGRLPVLLAMAASSLQRREVTSQMTTYQSMRRRASLALTSSTTILTVNRVLSGLHGIPLTMICNILTATLFRLLVRHLFN